MSRRLAFIALFLTTLLAGCSGDDETSATTTSTEAGAITAPSTAAITVRAAPTIAGPWRRSLSLEHGPDGQPTRFYVCAAWDDASPRAGCDAAPGAELPAGTVMRLEQRPVGSAPESPDSPGWATVGITEQPELRLPLSDFVLGLDVEKATYRVTLRQLEGGPALATSNPITVTWAS